MNGSRVSYCLVYVRTVSLTGARSMSLHGLCGQGGVQALLVELLRVVSIAACSRLPTQIYWQLVSDLYTKLLKSRIEAACKGST